MTIALIIQGAKDGAPSFDWSGVWTVAVALVTGAFSLISLRKSNQTEKVSKALDVRKFEAEERERALQNAVEECDRCRETLAAEREAGEAREAAAIEKLREAEEALHKALVSANDAWVLVGTYRERERVWLIERSELQAKLERKGQT